MNLGKLKKLAAAAIGSPLVVMLASLPGTPGKVAAGVIGAVTIYVNWGHAGSADSLREYLRSVIAPEIPLLLSRIEQLENPMVKDSIATLKKNLPIIESAMTKVISDEDAAAFDQLAADSQSIVDGLNAVGANASAAAAPVASTDATIPVATTGVAAAPIAATTDPNAVAAAFPAPATAPGA